MLECMAIVGKCLCFYYLYFVWARYFCMASFASVLSDLATTIGNLHDSTICLPLKDGGIPLTAFPNDTASKYRYKLAGFFSSLSLYVLSTQQKSCIYRFLKVFGFDPTRESNPCLPHSYPTPLPLCHDMVLYSNKAEGHKIKLDYLG